MVLVMVPVMVPSGTIFFREMHRMNAAAGAQTWRRLVPPLCVLWACPTRLHPLGLSQISPEMLRSRWPRWEGCKDATPLQTVSSADQMYQ